MEPKTIEAPAEEGKAVKKPIFLHIANNDTFVFECPKGIKTVSGTFNGEKASGVVINGVAHVKLTKALPETYTWELD